jgi:hypothetical protein
MIAKKVVVILVIIAVILATISLGYTLMTPSQKIPTNNPSSEALSNSGSGKIGVTINSPLVEDKTQTP